MEQRGLLRRAAECQRESEAEASWDGLRIGIDVAVTAQQTHGGGRRPSPYRGAIDPRYKAEYPTNTPTPIRTDGEDQAFPPERSPGSSSPSTKVSTSARSTAPRARRSPPYPHLKLMFGFSVDAAEHEDARSSSSTSSIRRRATASSAGFSATGRSGITCSGCGAPTRRPCGWK